MKQLEKDGSSHKTIAILEKMRHFSYLTSVYIQYFITFTIVVAIILSFSSLTAQWAQLTDFSSDSLIYFLKYITNIIIAVELIRVLCHHSLDTIVEILLIAITRELIIEHMQTYEFLLGVLAVGVLFLIRKYLFVSQLDREHRLELDSMPAEQAAKKTSDQSDSPH